VEAENTVQNKVKLAINVEQEVWDYQLYFLQTPKEITSVSDNETAYSAASNKSFCSCE
jgi:hypothetical protein